MKDEMIEEKRKELTTDHEEYVRFLRSPEWADIRAEVLERDGHRCQMCGSEQNLEVHHTSYDYLGRDENGGIGHLVTLCDKCHCDVHSFFPELKKAIELSRSLYTQECEARNEWYKEISAENRSALTRIGVRLPDDNYKLRKAHEEEAVNEMVFIADSFVTSRCSELSPDGDRRLMTGPNGSRDLNNYIRGLFDLSPAFQSVSGYWEDHGDGTPYSRIINTRRYNSMRLAINQRCDERLKYERSKRE